MTRADQSHERLTRDEPVAISSERSFGFVFAAVFAIIGLWPLLDGDGPRLWSLGVAVAFAAVAVLRPALLAPLNRLWARFGLLLHHVVNPVVMAVLFFLTITPIGLIARLFRKDPLNLKFEPDRRTYWIEREPPGPPPETMKNQF